MGNSTLVTYTKLSPNKTKPRNHTIDRITIHVFVGQVTAERGCAVFANPLRLASCNYVVGHDGSIGLCVEEANRSWCSSNKDNDHRAITIEVASETVYPYKVTDKAYDALILLCADICKRNGKKKLLWFGDKEKSLAYKPAADEMVMTVHRWFANKACPGEYLYNLHGDIAAKVNKLLGVVEEEKAPAPVPTVGKCDSVSILDGATYYNGKSIPAWVKKKQWVVSDVDGDRAVLGKSTDGKNNIQSAINTKYLKVVTTAKKEEAKVVTVLPYKVKVTASPVYIRKGAGINTQKVGAITDKGVYTIVEERDGAGATKWLKLKSGAGWIPAESCKKV